jgi:polyisoprenoid-binding protein YceI
MRISSVRFICPRLPNSLLKLEGLVIVKKIYFIIPILVIIAVGYWLYDYYAGNHIKIKEVIQTSPSPDIATGGILSLGQSNKNWKLTSESNVYFNVETSKEDVTFLLSNVTGEWNFNLSEPEKMTAHAKADILTMDSGNPSRDNDIKGSQYLDTGSYPEATFDLKSVEQWPDKWVEGEAAVFKMNGQLNVKGISKDVKFDSEAQFIDGHLKLKGQTVVTFQDFGMNNPHNIILDTENNIDVIIQLDLE